MALDWPDSFDRTPPGERESTTRFKSSRWDTIVDLRDCIRLMDVDRYRIDVDSGGRYTHDDGAPKTGANPDDPGAVVRWVDDERQYAVACDHWTDVDDNLRSIYLWLDETRKRNDRPVVTGSDAYAAAALPEGEPVAGEPAPHEVLGVPRDADVETIREAARELKAETHPDTGGERAKFVRVTKAEQQLLDENGGDA